MGDCSYIYFFPRAEVSEVLVSWQSQRWDVAISAILCCQNPWHELAASKEEILLEWVTIKEFGWWHVIFHKDAYWKTVPHIGTTTSEDPCLQPTSVKFRTPACAQLHILSYRTICGSKPPRLCSFTYVSMVLKDKTVFHVGKAAHVCTWLDSLKRELHFLPSHLDTLLQALPLFKKF